MEGKSQGGKSLVSCIKAVAIGGRGWYRRRPLSLLSGSSRTYRLGGKSAIDLSPVLVLRGKGSDVAMTWVDR